MDKPFRIYLDIDGVLVSYLNLKDRHEDGKHKFQKHSVEALNNIIELVKAELCIISTWGRRYYNYGDNCSNPIDDFKQILINRGVNFNYGLTFGDPDYRAKFVIDEKEKGYVNFLIIDDECFEYYDKVKDIGIKNICQCNPLRGLDDYDFKWFERNYK